MDSVQSCRRQLFFSHIAELDRVFIMPVRSRNSTPPFELMSTDAIASSGMKRRAHTDEINDEAPVEAAPPDARWWGRTRQPLVIRVPPGVLVVGVVGLLATIVLAYWAGQTRGYRSGQLVMFAGEGQSKIPAASATVVVTTEAEAAKGEAGQAKIGGVQTASETGALRRKGLNYFVLAHYPREEAARLVEFLHEHGLESAAYRVQNKRLFQVIALRGFEKDDILSPARQQLEQQVRELGRLWSAKHYGPDFSQTGIYLDLYEGEPVTETILVQQEQP